MTPESSVVQPLEFQGESTPHLKKFDGCGVTRLVLTDFRNYPDLVLSCDAGPVALSGPNGAGKTNILEALSLLSPGRGLRGIKLSEALYDDAVSAAGEERQESWSVAAQIQGLGGPVDLGVGFLGTGEREKRLIKIQGESVASQSALSEYVNFLWLTPQMDSVFIDGSSAKRKFFDRIVYTFDAAHAGRVLRYEHAMRERLRLLKMNLGHEESWFQALEHKMALEGVTIAGARLRTLQALSQAEHWALGVFPQAGLSLDGLLEKALEEGQDPLAIEQNFQDQLKQSRFKDRESGRTTLGPQRTDLKVTYVDKGRPAEHCSTGEQKALLLSIIMAACRVLVHQGNVVPIVLLDDLVAYLDDGRRRTLFEEILNLKLQVWMTSAEEDTFNALKGQIQHFRIVDGVLDVL